MTNPMMPTRRALVALSVLVLLPAACGGVEDAADPGDQVTASADALEDETTDGSESVSATDEGTVQAATPEPGGEPEVLFGTLAGGNTDVITVDVEACCTGETIYGSVNTDGGVTMSVMSPSGDTLAGDVSEFDLPVDETGTYTIVLTGEGDYDVALGLAVNAS